MRFTDEIAEYVILTLDLDHYRPSARVLPAEYEFVPSHAASDQHRGREKELLEMHFVAWTKPYRAKLNGFRRGSRIFLAHQGTLVAGVYLCDRNELDRPLWGQLHYAFMDPAHAGKGLYSVIFQEAVDRARTWGLQGLVLNSDRHLLPEVYIRWGAEPYKAVRKRLVRRLAGRVWNLVHGPARG